MVTPDNLRRLALLLPEAQEGDDHGKPAFMVGKKIFCTLSDEAAVVRLPAEDQHNLLDEGVIEAVPGYWGRKGWTSVHLPATDEAQVKTLLRLAWDGVAPKRIPRP
ncbi:MAG TPA: MmcQ/YjbR family DNA-binding protein [Phenylobacterium sp.]|nr:MmcQ/YjbR family DNA-binding protein [Phenylobacterium sp.]